MVVHKCSRITAIWAARMAPGLLLVLLTTAAAAETRRPNPLETAYTAMALDFGAHDLCERISPEAESRHLFNSPGTQIYRERSRCFLYTAVNTLNPYLCQFMIEASAWFHNGSYFSRENCKQLVAKARPFNFSISFDRQRVLTEMGYSATEIAQAFPGVPEHEAWHRFYLRAVGKDGNFQQRLKRLPDFAHPDN